MLNPYSLFKFKGVYVSLLLLLINCGSNQPKQQTISQDPIIKETEDKADIMVGASQTKEYLPLLQNKNVALLVNQTSTIDNLHLVDSLVNAGIKVKVIFAPEHGFRGTTDAGEFIANGKDSKTGIPIISLYGNKKKASSDDLFNIDIVVFDIQDVGARFYTYISSMHYMMETCAENMIQFMVLDRPNPNGHYVDGPILDSAFQSFVGMHPIPVVHGLTVGELAQMINEEGWLANGEKVDLKIIGCKNYRHDRPYSLPIKPSPNLPNDQSIALYPSLCFFEGTDVSIGRGTDFPFQVYGHPDSKLGEFEFTPEPTNGAKNPKHNGQLCLGKDLRNKDVERISELNINYLLQAYEQFSNKQGFFLKNNFIDLLAGTDELKDMILARKSAEEIRESWKTKLEEYKKRRERYLLYP